MVSLEDTVKYLIKFDQFIKRKPIELDNLITYNDFSYNYSKTKNSTIENIFTRQIRCVIKF